ncbi:TolC family protein [Pyxidicoccus fallax]|uniref:TolC family protein n=1 Tax=Pyxidicoccus fallax TaxID=394095 RepID=A0A848LQ04_9BACT|nr:TolC family protein [Pyxidicoccus fallax]NMO19836.1 TolC family protein [Pyxidicoccus fallax]NPC85963.1 TolC family protein [Pyxidicoccus fallax]
MWVLLVTILASAPASGLPPLTFEEAQAQAAQAALPASLARAVETRRVWDARLPALAANPTLSVIPGWRAQPDGSGLELTVGVEQPLFLSNLAGAQRDAARAETHAAEKEAVAVLLDRRLEVARAWLALWAAQQAAASAEHEAELAETLRKSMVEALALGGATRLEVAEAEGFEAEARLARLSRDAEVMQARLSLAVLLGRPPGAPLVAAEALPVVALPPASEEARWLARAGELPEAEARRLLGAAERARAAEARAERGWQVTVGAQGVREYYGGFSGLLTVGVTAPVFDSGQRARGALLAAAERLDGEAREAAVRAAAELALAFHEREHADAQLVLVEKSLVPSAEEAARLAEVLLRAGQSTLPDVLRARRARAAANARLAFARGEASLAAARLHLLLSALP